MGLSGGEVVADVLKKLLASETDGIQVLEAFVKAAQNRNEYPILIIDEANLAFSPDVSKNKPILDKLVQLTKQQREMMTLFTSSEHAYPYKLDRIGFNQADLKKVIYAGEIPPKEMRELLVSRLGMGDRLADGFLSAFGGHIYTTESVPCPPSLSSDSHSMPVRPTLYRPKLRRQRTYSTPAPRRPCGEPRHNRHTPPPAPYIRHNPPAPRQHSAPPRSPCTQRTNWAAVACTGTHCGVWPRSANSSHR